MKNTLQQPGRSIYKLEPSILNIFKFSIAADYRTIEQGQTMYSFFCVFFSEKNGTVGSYKTGSVSKPQTHIFFLALADLIYSTQAAVLRYHPTIFNNDSGLRQIANLQCA